jgi:hypothetical protein
MKLRLVITFLVLILAQSCATHKVGGSPSLDRFAFNIFYVSGGPGPEIRSACFFNDGTVILKAKNKEHLLILTSKEKEQIWEIAFSDTLRNEITTQKARGPAFGCCDAEELGISFEAPPNHNAILHAVSFYPAMFPKEFSRLIGLITEILRKKGYEPFIQKWYVIDG